MEDEEWLHSSVSVLWRQIGLQALAPLKPGSSQSPLQPFSAVNHLDADRGRFADNVDPFEVKVGRRPAPLMGACLLCTFLADKGCPTSAGWNSCCKNVSMLTFSFGAIARPISSVSLLLFVPSHHSRSLSTLPRRDRRPRLKGLKVARLNGLFPQSGERASANALRELYEINQLGAAGLRDGDKK